MSIIAILPAEDTVSDADDLADTRHGTPGAGGGSLPGGLAGYTYDGAAYCPDCAEGVEIECADTDQSYSMDHFPPRATDPNGFGVGVIECTDEWDYPGASCFGCHKRLDTNVLVYDDHGAHPEPVVRVRDPDRARDPVTAFVLERDDDAGDVRIMLAEDFGSNGDPGDTTWIPEGDVLEEVAP